MHKGSVLIIILKSVHVQQNMFSPQW